MFIGTVKTLPSFIVSVGAAGSPFSGGLPAMPCVCCTKSQREVKPVSCIAVVNIRKQVTILPAVTSLDYVLEVRYSQVLAISHEGSLGP